MAGMVLAGAVGCGPTEDAVYVAGTSGSWNRPWVFHDGDFEELVTEEGDFHASAADLLVDEGEVVVAGTYRGQAVLWTDGELEVLCDPGAAVALQRGEQGLYVGGECGGQPGFWLDGTWSALTNPGDYAVIADMDVDGGEVYLVGSVCAGGGMPDCSPHYWAGEEVLPINDGSGGEADELLVEAVVAVDGDVRVYGAISGMETQGARWVDGVHEPLSCETVRAATAAGGATYLAARCADGPCWLKDDKVHTLEAPLDGQALDIAVSGGQVVVAGEYGSWDEDYAAFWIGGALHEVLDDQGEQLNGSVLDVTAVWVDD